MMIVFQTVAGSARTFVSLGSLRPPHGRAPWLSGSAWGRRREQVGVEPQAGDEADMAADGSDQFDRGEAGIGDDDDEPVGQPAPDLENALPGPVRQGLVTPPMGFVVT